ncbi:LysM domain-containing protein [Herbinix hemicellulosilytica]|mgnify:CR=1 FL=1|uniref:LysM domain-containing protein n=1 Tax=Herbinix hemicellulosilytica TaxID=1564487 RepID=A0A0H5SFZ9_HERHM|nr:LysM peptidoglycan-binding domain-containing protein [Herbinix hemicellulosilytica]RBP60707.1 LysM domain-containing protein [Herbinix hemicellulosilytica]CRZ34394.1 hypothetical protein HHT355_1192 [Herbinix hemicellulosilytica]
MNNTYLNDLDSKPARKSSYNRSGNRNIKWLGLAIIIIIIILTVLFTTKTATATNSNKRVKQVTSVQIQNGDTLWSIASRYMSCEYKDLNEYVEEIMLSNGLTSEKIHAGNYIIVPYYTDSTNY